LNIPEVGNAAHPPLSPTMNGGWAAKKKKQNFFNACPYMENSIK
jgi:hypothetical protein